MCCLQGISLNAMQKNNLPGKVLVLVPARYQSKRLPGKLLKKIGKLSVLGHVYHSLLKCSMIDTLSFVVDHELLANEMEELGAPYIVNNKPYSCGTDRCLGSLKNFEVFDYLVNVQADQPELDPLMVDHFIAEMIRQTDSQIWSVRTTSPCRSTNTNTVKVDEDENGFAIDFYRSLPSEVVTYRHMGVYGFHRGVVDSLVKLQPSQRELSLGLEQLRWMDAGYNIKMIPFNTSSESIDTQEDMESLQAKHEH